MTIPSKVAAAGAGPASVGAAGSSKDSTSFKDRLSLRGSGSGLGEAEGLSSTTAAASDKHAEGGKERLQLVPAGSDRCRSALLTS
mmetsp:Transcript_108855/g.198246  ORF Transcript_108855/g.198246 Transcript_108855/m.198246 type:complete len:85 (-) Transcript_108855:58-312(-)